MNLQTELKEASKARRAKRINAVLVAVAVVYSVFAAGLWAI